MGDQPVIIVAASRPYPGETANGDGWTVSWHNGICRIVVIDGLGHGLAAAAATQAAIDALAAQPHLLPEEALRASHAALHGTRGAVMSIAVIDPQAARLIYAGVGNVEARLWQSGSWQRLIAYRGIVGATLPTLHSFTFSLEPDWLLLLHTDGVSARFDGDKLPHDPHQEPQAFADAVLAEWGRPTDDATIVVAGPRRERLRQARRRQHAPSA
jgi:serine phosphatase RsbU (regulator of sigma subunit)